jgi:hypothetical protein
LSNNFPLQNGLKQEDTLSPLLFNFTVEYAIRKVQENHQVGLKLNGTPQLLVYADDVNLLGDSINNVKKNTNMLFDASREVGVKTRYMLLSCHQNSVKNHNKNIAKICFENVA